MRNPFDNFISAFSSPVRFEIISLLAQQSRNLTELAEGLGITSISVVSRHLARLGEQGLIQKESISGRNYTLTSFGQSVAGLLGPLEFVFKHQDYFREHSLNALPHCLLRDIDALNDATMIIGVGNVVMVIKEFVEGIERSGASMFDAGFGNTNDNIQELKIIAPARYHADPETEKWMGNVSKQVKWEDIDFRLLPRVLIGLAIADGGKKGLMFFPKTDEDRPDYSTVFVITDDRGMDFLKEAWNYYWELAEPPR